MYGIQALNDAVKAHNATFAALRAATKIDLTHFEAMRQATQGVEKALGSTRIQLIDNSGVEALKQCSASWDEMLRPLRQATKPSSKIRPKPRAVSPAPVPSSGVATDMMTGAVLKEDLSF